VVPPPSVSSPAVVPPLGATRNTGIEGIQALNYVPEAATVRVRLTEDGSRVYRTTERVPAYSPADEQTGAVRLTGLPDDSGDYTLHVRTEAQAPNTWKTSDLGEQDADCLECLVEIGSHRTDADNTRDEVGLLFTGGEGCGSTATE